MTKAKAKQLEIKLTHDTAHDTYRKPNGEMALCAQITRNYTEFPLNIEVLFAVFTAKRNSDSFRIHWDRNCHTTTAPEIAYELPAVNTHLLFSAKGELMKAYKAGYRYVHLEYEV